MDFAIKFAKVFALLAVAALAMELGRFVRHADAALAETQAKTDAILLHLDQAAKESADASRDTRRSIVHFDRTLTDVHAMVLHADAMLAHTDSNLNARGGVMYQAGKLLHDTNDSLNDEKTGLIPAAGLAVMVAAKDVNEISEAAIPVIQHADDLVQSPAIKNGVAHFDGSMQHIESILAVGDEVLHPPKKTRGQRILQWILQTVFGNAVQGAVRR